MNAEYSDIYNHNEANLSLVSIIMPVYNTPINNLMNSVSSIINQTYKAIELIIVDDGSSLECAKVCDDLAERDARICVIHQNNNGVSMARNKGLDVAKGEWIMFADADDVYYPSAVERGVSLAMEYELDIVYAEVVYVGFDGKREFRKFEISKPGSLEIISERDSLHSLAIYFIASRIIPFSVIPNNLSSGPWSRIFRASTIGACRFDQRLKILEDALFNSSVVLNATKIGFVCEPWYEYYQYIGSALHRMTFENESELHCNIIRDYVAMHSLSIDAYYYHACSYFFFAMRSLNVEGKLTYRELKRGYSLPWFNSAFRELDRRKILYRNFSEKIRFYFACTGKLRLLWFANKIKRLALNLRLLVTARMSNA